MTHFVTRDVFFTRLTSTKAWLTLPDTLNTAPLPISVPLWFSSGRWTPQTHKSWSVLLNTEYWVRFQPSWAAISTSARSSVG